MHRSPSLDEPPDSARDFRDRRRRQSGVVRLAAHPRMLGDVEDRAVWAFELDLEEAFAVAFVLAHEAFGPEPFQLRGGLVGIFDQNAEVMHAGEVHALTNLVGLKLE